MFQFRAFPPYGYLIHRTVLRYCLSGFPHSEIPGSQLICSSPRLIAACRVLLRLLMPRHSPCALISFTCVEEICAPLHPPSGEYPFRSDPFSFPIQTRLRWALNRREEIVPISSDVFLVLELCRINRSCLTKLYYPSSEKTSFHSVRRLPTPNIRSILFPLPLKFKPACAGL